MVRGGFARKGMSPLIATVLLMAFAVALGGMIMNWSFDVEIDQDCQGLRDVIKVSKFCTEGPSMIIGGSSTPEAQTLAGFEILISNDNIENTVRVKESKVEPGKPFTYRVGVPVPEGSTVTVYGVMGSPSSPVVCKQSPIEKVEAIGACA